MHTHRNKHTPGVFASVMFLVLGVIVFLGFYTGFLRFWNWPFILIGLGVFIIIITGSSNSRRRRAEHRATYQVEQRVKEPYVPTKNPFFEREKKELERQEIERQPEIVFQPINEPIFCTYCGMKIQQKVRFCSNCGNQLE